jgi:hypothetical protein
MGDRHLRGEAGEGSAKRARGVPLNYEKFRWITQESRQQFGTHRAGMAMRVATPGAGQVKPVELA